MLEFAQYNFLRTPLVRKIKTERKFVRANYKRHFITEFKYEHAQKEIDWKIHQGVVKAKNWDTAIY